MINILLVKSKWNDLNPEKGIISNSKFLVEDTLDHLEFINYKVWYYDEEIYKGNATTAYHTLARLMLDNVFDLCILEVVPINTPLAIETNFVHSLKKDLDIPFVFLWWDTWAFHLNEMPKYADISAVDMCMDGPFYMHTESCLDCGNFSNEYIMKKGDIEQDINISFIGSYNRPRRYETLKNLQLNNIDIYLTGGFFHDTCLSLDDYITALQRSKMTLNMSEDKNNMKARIWEATLCGSLLFDDGNKVTEQYFIPDKHYIRYEDDMELIDKIEYYKDHDAERLIIANVGHEHAKNICSSYKKWIEVFTKAGISI
jgi:hypothetical protein